MTKVPERTLESHLRYATFTFRDIVHNRLGGRNPFSNQDVRYTGSHDDKALNAGVERFSADQSAFRDLSFDSDLTGAISIPVLTLHAIDDPTVFIEHESAYHASLEGAKTGQKPTPESVAASCPAFDATYGTGCFYDPDYVPADYASKVYPRKGARHWPALTAAQAEEWERRGDVGIEP